VGALPDPYRLSGRSPALAALAVSGAGAGAGGPGPAARTAGDVVEAWGPDVEAPGRGGPGAAGERGEGDGGDAGPGDPLPEADAEGDDGSLHPAEAARGKRWAVEVAGEVVDLGDGEGWGAVSEGIQAAAVRMGLA